MSAARPVTSTGPASATRAPFRLNGRSERTRKRPTPSETLSLRPPRLDDILTHRPRFLTAPLRTAGDARSDGSHSRSRPHHRDRLGRRCDPTPPRAGADLVAKVPPQLELRPAGPEAFRCDQAHARRPADGPGERRGHPDATTAQSRRGVVAERLPRG